MRTIRLLMNYKWCLCSEFCHVCLCQRGKCFGFWSLNAEAFWNNALMFSTLTQISNNFKGFTHIFINALITIPVYLHKLIESTSQRALWLLLRLPDGICAMLCLKKWTPLERSSSHCCFIGLTFRDFKLAIHFVPLGIQKITIIT